MNSSFLCCLDELPPSNKLFWLIFFFSISAAFFSPKRFCLIFAKDTFQGHRVPTMFLNLNVFMSHCCQNKTFSWEKERINSEVLPSPMSGFDSPWKKYVSVAVNKLRERLSTVYVYDDLKITPLKNEWQPQKKTIIIYTSASHSMRLEIIAEDYYRGLRCVSGKSSTLSNIIVYQWNSSKSSVFNVARFHWRCSHRKMLYNVCNISLISYLVWDCD